MFLAETPGTHVLTPVCGDQALNLLVVKFYYCAFTLDTLTSSGLAVLVTLAVAFLIASQTRPGVPGKLQMVLEYLYGYVQGLVRETVAEEARFVVPLAATIGLYILIANWLTFFPLAGPFLPANADLNQTLAMALVVIVLVQGYSIRVLGLRGYLRRFTRPFEMSVLIRAAFVPLNIIEEIVKPVTLALRLFGNIFAGVLMVFLLTLLFGVAPLWSLPALVGLVAWKFFDVFFVGTIQAFIFMLLTIIYFGMAREGLEEEEHHRSRPSPAGAVEGGDRAHEPSLRPVGGEE
jgi:F-type H+-transporting ATPase subunit a